MNAIENIALNARLAWTSAENAPSPCVSVCQMDAVSGWCAGCLRTLPEIAAWSQLDEDAKRAVWRQLGLRAASLMPPQDER